MIIFKWLGAAADARQRAGGRPERHSTEHSCARNARRASEVWSRFGVIQAAATNMLSRVERFYMTDGDVTFSH